MKLENQIQFYIFDRKYVGILTLFLIIHFEIYYIACNLILCLKEGKVSPVYLLFLSMVKIKTDYVLDNCLFS